MTVVLFLAVLIPFFVIRRWVQRSVARGKQVVQQKVGAVTGEYRQVKDRFGIGK